MKIAIIGYGRMGRLIEEVAKNNGHEVVSTLDKGVGEISKAAEVAIDFSVPEAMEENISELCQQKIPVVIGTTGWLDRKERYEKIFQETGNVGIWSGNFSLGVNLFWQILNEASKIMDKFGDQYDVMVHEYHHKNKIDSPSGTALHSGDILLKNSSFKNKIITEKLDRKIEPSELHVSSTRGGSIPGTHVVTWDGEADMIELKHTARSRIGFAQGAVLAAEKIKKFKPGLYNFSNIFQDINC